jgi:phosphonopyruvate decarboxylase
MIQAAEWFDEALSRGIDFFAGVPCSYLTPFINFAIGDRRAAYVGAASEGEAVAIAAGAWLGGRKTVAMCQNSGLGNMVNPLTSLCEPFRIPVLVVTTWRGEPSTKAEPQHRLMGRATQPLLDALEIPHEVFPSEPDDVGPSLDRALSYAAESGLPYAFVMRKGTVAPHPLTPRPVERGEFPTERLSERPLGSTVLSRRAALALAIDALGPERAYLATTGKLGRELFTLGDRPNQLYHVGAMGCVSGVGLGLALARPERRVVVLDGDGSLLMKMGALATIGHHAPRNLLHVVFDNERHESTGGQATVSPTVEFARVAAAAGYRRAYTCSAPDDVAAVLAEAGGQDGPVFVHVKVGVDTDPGLLRPTVTPAEVARRFRAWLDGERLS